MLWERNQSVLSKAEVGKNVEKNSEHIYIDCGGHIFKFSFAFPSTSVQYKKKKEKILFVAFCITLEV